MPRVVGWSFALAVLMLLVCIAAVGIPTSSVRADGTPDLRIIKLNNVSGELMFGGAFTWSLTVTNAGGDATFTDGQTILTDNLPAMASYSGLTIEGIDNVNGHTNIRCSLAGSDLSCAATGGNVTIGSTTGTFAVSLIATPTTAGTLVNPRSDGICRVDPSSLIAESDDLNNDCTDAVAVTQPNLQVSKVNDVGTTVAVQSEITWTWTITNAGTGPATFTAGKVLLRDNLPEIGGTYGAATPSAFVNIAGSNRIACTIVGDDLTCTVSTGTVTVAAGGRFDVRVTFAANVPGTLTNPRQGGSCAVDPDGLVAESNETDNSCSDVITILGPELTVTKTNNVGGATTVGSPWTWTWTVKNTGTYLASFANTRTILFDQLPTGGVTYGDPTVGNTVNVTGAGQVSCSISNDDLICMASGGAVVIGEATGSFTVMVTVTPTTPGVVVNPRPSGACTVDGTDQAKEHDEANNTCADTVTVSATPPDLRVSKTNNTTGSATIGSTFSWVLTVANTGSGAATFADGQVILIDDLPSGASYQNPTVDPGSVGVTGTENIGCAIVTNTLTCRASGGSVTIGGTTGTFTVGVPVTPTVSGALNNPRVDGTCKVDPSGPNGVISESNETNNTCSNNVTVVPKPDLKVTKSNNVGGQATEGTSWTWTWDVQNIGGSDATFASLENLLLDLLPPSGLVFDEPAISNKVNVGGSGTLTCVRQGTSSTPHVRCTATGGSVVLGVNGGFRVSMTVTASQPGTYQSSFSAVDPDGVVTESDETNNGGADIVRVAALPADLQVSKTNNVGGSTTLGLPFDWAITVTNVGRGDAKFAPNDIILIDNLPAGLSVGTPVVSNVNILPTPSALSCSISGPSSGAYTLHCRASSVETIIPREGGGFTVTVRVTPTMSGTFVNPRPGTDTGCMADPNAVLTETTLTNNICANTVTVTAPDLQVSKTNTVSGTAELNRPFSWALKVTNTGNDSATFSDGQAILIDELPSTGATYGPVTQGSFVGITNSGNVRCDIAGTTLVCTASGGSVTIGAGTGSFTASVPVTPTAAGTLVNPASVDGCKVDPGNANGVISESNEDNNTCADTVTVSPAQPDLKITTSNNTSGTATVGTAFTWSMTVANTGSADATFSNGQTILADELPTTGATYESPTLAPGAVNVIGADNVSCAVLSNILTCTASGSNVTLGATTGAFTVNLPVRPTATGTLRSPRDGGTCTVDPAGLVTESSESNNACGPDTVSVAGTPNLQVVQSTAIGPTAIVGNEFDWTWTIANVGSGPASFTAGQTIMLDNLPSGGATYRTPVVGGSTDVVGIGNVACTVAANNLLCTVQSGSVTLAATSGSFKVTVPTTPTEAGALTNPRAGGACAVDPSGVVSESGEGDNGCSQTVTVVMPADLRVTASNSGSGSAVVGSPWVWTWVIANSGGSSATFAGGTPILVSHLPSSGLTYGTPAISSPSNVSGAGTMTCSIVTAILSCTANSGTVVLGSNGSITVTVSVTPTTAGTFVTPRPGGECTVDPSLAIAEGNEANNSCSDTVVVSAAGQPDLNVQATNNVGGSATLGIPFTWTMTITNTGAAATFSPDQPILSDTLPLSGATYGTPQIGGLSGITNGNNLRCEVSAGVLSCKPNGGSVTIGATAGSFTVAVPVTPTAIGTLNNPRTGTLCMVDPDNLINEGNEANNLCQNSVTVSAVPQPDLRVSAINSTGGAAVVGGSFDWTLAVVNAGTGPATFTNGQTVLTDHLPSGATYLAPTVGSLVGVTGGTVSCGVSGADLVCTASGGSVTLGAVSGSFKVTVPVRPTAPGTLANPRGGGACVVDPNGTVAESNESNNLCADTVMVTSPPATATATPTATATATPVPTSTPVPTATPVVPVAPERVVPDLQIVANGPSTATVAIGSAFTWNLAVTNTGTGPAVFTSGQTILVDHLPTSGANHDAPTVGGAANVTGAANIQCVVESNTLSCVAGGGNVVLGAGGGAFTVTVPVTPTTFGMLANPAGGGICAVDPAGVVTEANEGNNTCSIGVTVRRPTVTLTTTRVAPGTLSVTIAAAGPANTLREVRVGEVRNATVQVAGETGGTGMRVPLPTSPTSVVVTVTRTNGGEVVHVPLVIVDQHGDWPTFVGGGPEAF